VTFFFTFQALIISGKRIGNNVEVAHFEVPQQSFPGGTEDITKKKKLMLTWLLAEI
jgi:hypothetical protein